MASPKPSTEHPSKLSTSDQFARVLAQVRSLLDSGALHWRLTGPGTISPRLDEDEVGRSVGAKDSPERLLFERVLSREIIPALTRALGTTQHSIYVVLDAELSAADREETAARQQRIVQDLYNDALRQRVLIRRTCKGPVLEELRWDISIKKHDLATGGIPDVPYATIELVYLESTAEGGGGPLSLFASLGVPRRTVTFDCHLHDLDALLRDLNDLRANLEKLTTVTPGTTQ